MAAAALANTPGVLCYPLIVHTCIALVAPFTHFLSVPGAASPRANEADGSRESTPLPDHTSVKENPEDELSDDSDAARKPAPPSARHAVRTAAASSQPELTRTQGLGLCGNVTRCPAGCYVW